MGHHFLDHLPGYEDRWEHMSDELKWLDLKIFIYMQFHQSTVEEEDAPQPFKGWSVSEEEVYGLLRDDADRSPIQGDPEYQTMQTELQQVEERIVRRVERSWEDGIFLSLSHLAYVFGLTRFEQKCVLIALAVELDRKYERIYAFLHDDLTRKYPSVDLVLRLLSITPREMLANHAYFSPSGELFTYCFLQDEQETPQETLLMKPLRLDPRIVRFLLNNARSDERIATFTEICYPSESLPALLWEQDIQDRIRNFLEYHVEEAGVPAPLFVIQGNPGSGKKLHVKHLAVHMQRPVVLIDCQRMLQTQPDADFKQVLRRAMREALLHQAVLAFDNVHLLYGENGSSAQIQQLLQATAAGTTLTFLLTEREWKEQTANGGQPIVSIELQVPPAKIRGQIWKQFHLDYPVELDIEWQVMANKFRFTIGQIRQALDSAARASRWQAPTKARISSNTLNQACYALVQHKLTQKATRLEVKYGFDDLILPHEQKEQLRNACNQIKYRSVVFDQWGFEQKLPYGKGLSLLFGGPPGTGKTMAAQVIAHELRLEMYKVDLSQIISKYIGETEKNLHEVFAEASNSSAILFFDEADALFGKRTEVSDSHDKYANIETSYLLQKIEEYEGISILATNYQQNIDEAFIRRINYVIKFPFPDAEQRYQIWRGMFPKATPLEADIDFKVIAETFPLSGGNIKNAVLSAAFLAAETGSAVAMRHLVQAIKFEYQKTGKIMSREEAWMLEEYTRAK